MPDPSLSQSVASNDLFEIAFKKPQHGCFLGLLPSIIGPDADASAVFREAPCRIEITDDGVVSLDIQSEPYIRLLCRWDDFEAALAQAKETADYDQENEDDWAMLSRAYATALKEARA